MKTSQYIYSLFMLIAPALVLTFVDSILAGIISLIVNFVLGALISYLSLTLLNLSGKKLLLSAWLIPLFSDVLIIGGYLILIK